MAGINEWAKRIRDDEAFAKKFKGIDDPKEIIALARKNGYEITAQDLNDLKMETASGGSDVLSWLFRSAKNCIKELSNLREKQKEFEKTDFTNAPKIGVGRSGGNSSTGNGVPYGPASNNKNSGPPEYM